MTLNNDVGKGRTPLLHHDVSDKTLRAFHQVHHELGFGYSENIYVSAMARALTDLGLSVERQKAITVHFRGDAIGMFKADLIVESAVMLELKAMRQPEPAFEAQLLNYLRATPIEVGLLLYFNPKPLKKRLIYTNDRKLFG
jgi:GxxExxY protein